MSVSMVSPIITTWSGSLRASSDNLRRARGIDGANSFGCFETLATNDQGVLHAEVRGHEVKRAAHGARIFRITEVGKRLVGERTLRRTRLYSGIDACNGHNEFSLVQKAAGRNEGAVSGSRGRLDEAPLFCRGCWRGAKIAGSAADLPLKSGLSVRVRLATQSPLGRE